jgi:hypothetical protein
MSRAAFAQLTKLGEATIARWERGGLIQNAAHDQFLYLLTFEENIKRLTDRNEHKSQSESRTSETVPPPRFRVLRPTDEDREVGRTFELNRFRKGA